MFLFLALSGNPFFSITGDTSKYLFVAFVLFLVLKHRIYFDLTKGIIFYWFLLFFSVLFVFQKMVLGFLSYPSAIAFLSKITFGYIVIRFLGHNFKYAYFQLIFFISIISLIGYLWNVLGYDIPAVYLIERTDLYSDNSGRNIILFHQNASGLRNSGMFWEPGAFACYICLAFLFYLGKIRTLLKHHRFKVLIILLALITTYSTTGYVVLFILCLATIYFEYSRKYGKLVLPLLLVFSLVAYGVYENTDFLKDKIEGQFMEASNRDQGEFAPDRMSALLFDIHYIKKHPLVGNGYDSSTRFADHPALQKEVLGHGNGFSDFLASMGVLSLLFYSFYVFKYNKNHGVLFLMAIFILLQGEPLLIYPLFLSLPFVFIYEKYNRRIINLPQQEAKDYAVS
jgi:hypothetical protein